MQVQTPLRIPADELEALRGYAAMRDRSLAEELRFAVRLYLRQLALAHLGTPEGQAEVKDQGLDVAAERKWIKNSLATVSNEAFRPYAKRDYRSGLS